MLAAPKQKKPIPPTSLQPSGAPHRHLEVVSSPVQAAPPWLRLMLGLRRVSTPLVVMLTLSLLPLYSWTVHTQKSWGKTYAQLEELKRNERDLLIQNESRQHHITENAEVNPAGLTPKGPHNTLFVKPESAKLPQTSLEPRHPLIRMSPIGY
jgi:hypothetical protein